MKAKNNLFLDFLGLETALIAQKWKRDDQNKHDHNYSSKNVKLLDNELAPGKVLYQSLISRFTKSVRKRYFYIPVRLVPLLKLLLGQAQIEI